MEGDYLFLDAFFIVHTTDIEIWERVCENV